MTYTNRSLAQMSGCTGKHGFNSKKMAQQSARNINGAHGAYSCKFCGSWHVGHSSPSKSVQGTKERKQSLFNIRAMEASHGY